MDREVIVEWRGVNKESSEIVEVFEGSYLGVVVFRGRKEKRVFVEEKGG